MEQYYFRTKNGHVGGPVSAGALRQMQLGGVVPDDAEVRRDGTDIWRRIAPVTRQVPRPTAANGVVIGGYLCALISLLLFPPAFAVAAFVLGIVSVAKGSVGHGIAIIILAAACGLIGMYFGFVVTMPKT
jgi:hypothetical protein